MGQYGHAFDSFISKRIEDIQSIQENCIGKGNGMSAYVYKQETRELKGNPDNAYIEVYNNESQRRATKMIRLVVGQPYYRDHSGQKPLWKMNKNEVKALKSFLSSDSTEKEFEGYTVFGAALKFYEIDPSVSMPDYTNMKLEPSAKEKKKEQEDSKKKK